MNKVDATLFIEVLCHCPVCGSIDDIFDNDIVKESLGSDNRSYNCDIEINCSECDAVIIVENINF